MESELKIMNKISVLMGVISLMYVITIICFASIVINHSKKLRLLQEWQQEWQLKHK